MVIFWTPLGITLIWQNFSGRWESDFKILIIFDDMIADMLTNKKLTPVVIKLHFSCFYHAILFCCAKKISNWILHNSDVTFASDHPSRFRKNIKSDYDI